MTIAEFCGLGNRLLRPKVRSLAFSDRLEALIAEFSGGNRAAFARFCGIQESSVRQYVTGTKPSLENLVAISDATKRSLDWLVREADSQISAPAEALGELSGDFALVPRYDVRASAGLGALVHAETIAEHLAFRRDWLSRLGITPANGILAEIAGDSMEPTIPDGALILINTAVHRVQNGYIYAIRREDELLVKRVQIRVDGTVVLISDNARYDREEFSADRAVDLHVVGQVVWNAYALVGKGRL